MQVHYDINHLPDFTNAVLTVGTFDGVHQGHQQIIRQLQQEARAAGGETVIITFHPHPRMVVSLGRPPIGLLNTLAEKEALLRHYGIDHLVVVPFNEAFAALSPDAYISDFLVARFRPHTIITGYDHKFGHHRAGDYQLLEAGAARHGYRVKEIPAQVLQDAAISSTRIRAALLEGDCLSANRFLGYRYFFTGAVGQGNRLGRTIGYPTANLQVPEPQKLVPGNGVYAVQAIVNNREQVTHVQDTTPAAATLFNGMMNIGTRPTVDGTTTTIEVNLFDFDADIYGQSLTVFLRKWLRSEVKFDGVDALKAQLAKDKMAALDALKTEA